MLLTNLTDNYIYHLKNGQTPKNLTPCSSVIDLRFNEIWMKLMGGSAYSLSAQRSWETFKSLVSILPTPPFDDIGLNLRLTFEGTPQNQDLIRIIENVWKKVKGEVNPSRALINELYGPVKKQLLFLDRVFEPLNPLLAEKERKINTPPNIAALAYLLGLKFYRPSITSVLLANLYDTRSLNLLLLVETFRKGRLPLNNELPWPMSEGLKKELYESFLPLCSLENSLIVFNFILEEIFLGNPQDNLQPIEKKLYLALNKALDQKERFKDFLGAIQPLQAGAQNEEEFCSELKKVATPFIKARLNAYAQSSSTREAAIEEIDEIIQYLKCVSSRLNVDISRLWDHQFLKEQVLHSDPEAILLEEEVLNPILQEISDEVAFITFRRKLPETTTDPEAWIKESWWPHTKQVMLEKISQDLKDEIPPADTRKKLARFLEYGPAGAELSKQLLFAELLEDLIDTLKDQPQLQNEFRIFLIPDMAKKNSFKARGLAQMAFDYNRNNHIDNAKPWMNLFNTLVDTGIEIVERTGERRIRILDVPLTDLCLSMIHSVPKQGFAICFQARVDLIKTLIQYSYSKGDACAIFTHKLAMSSLHALSNMSNKEAPTIALNFRDLLNMFIDELPSSPALEKAINHARLLLMTELEKEINLRASSSDLIEKAILQVIKKVPTVSVTRAIQEITTSSSPLEDPFLEEKLISISRMIPCITSMSSPFAPSQQQSLVYLAIACLRLLKDNDKRLDLGLEIIKQIQKNRLCYEALSQEILCALRTFPADLRMSAYTKILDSKILFSSDMASQLQDIHAAKDIRKMSLHEALEKIATLFFPLNQKLVLSDLLKRAETEFPEEIPRIQETMNDLAMLGKRTINQIN